MLTIKQASELIGVDRVTLRRWEKAGKIKSTRTEGGHRRYDVRQERISLNDVGHQPGRSARE